MLTDKQKEVLNKFRISGTKGFHRIDYHHLMEIKKRCKYTIENYNHAVKILAEISINKKGGKV